MTDTPELERAREIAILLDDKCRRGSSEDGMWKEGYRSGLYDEGPTVARAVAILRTTSTGDTTLRETAWLIELGSSEPCNPRYWGGCHGWTYDHLKAVRFCREVDAQLIAEQMSAGAPDEYRLAEHIWEAATIWPTFSKSPHAQARNPAHDQ